jgi:hypothetical protein
MWKDPIVEEVRKVRERHAAQFNYDVEAICRDVKEQERKAGRKLVSVPPGRCSPRRRSHKRRWLQTSGIVSIGSGDDATRPQGARQES